jgi:uncharacterized protein (TIGR03000 family)
LLYLILNESREAIVVSPFRHANQEEWNMLNKSLWGVALTMVAGLGLLLTPGTGESRGGGGGHGGGGHGGGGFHGGGFHGGGFHGGGFHGGGFRRGFIGGGFYGAGFGYPYYGWDWGSPYYGSGYDSGYYSNDWAAPSYYTAPPATYYVQPSYYTVTPEAGYYGSTGTAGSTPPAVNPNEATFTVRLPDPNAEVWFQAYKTHERGSVRQFDSAALQPGTTYTFHIRARWNKNGQSVEQTRDVPARAGQHLTVDFQQPTN